MFWISNDLSLLKCDFNTIYNRILVSQYIKQEFANKISFYYLNTELVNKKILNDVV